MNPTTQPRPLCLPQSHTRHGLAVAAAAALVLATLAGCHRERAVAYYAPAPAPAWQQPVQVPAPAPAYAPAQPVVEQAAYYAQPQYAQPQYVQPEPVCAAPTVITQEVPVYVSQPVPVYVGGTIVRDRVIVTDRDRRDGRDDRDRRDNRDNRDDRRTTWNRSNPAPAPFKPTPPPPPPVVRKPDPIRKAPPAWNNDVRTTGGSKVVVKKFDAAGPKAPPARGVEKITARPVRDNTPPRVAATGTPAPRELPDKKTRKNQ